MGARTVESVWDYPRPPGVEPDDREVTVRFGGETIAATTSAIRVLETSHPPVFYLPSRDIRMEFLYPVAASTWCEFKGRAAYWTVAVDGDEAPAAAWSYPSPTRGYESLAGHFAFYPSRMDACHVGGELVRAQAGDFYGGWITSEIEGPFKGAPGTEGW